ncbi:MAG: polyprenyl synthetase family protein [Acetobacter fabarum]|jgi:farnesyl diphosphate synthase|uniref:polyprenyl synthetase family protein n=1 Tax=Acetobacter fabarum TaxID=483199 RepID=UPI0024322278|nr:farnesyl diphosphate synthase [Acetobacter fabarum]MCH4026596.1 polyprenyl synthetase family protein [Acetobacter fabarum]MCH4085543.1 polyprenyl synthetase family protein [Acetobacter fabarum]MCH4126914.1 polyprenyl synthetase family protein [Acetobacter fabarum]MCH4137215.1 polyprenyl synthetase family protein [Acetobacter fabarum]MCH4140125.1 polyprenyl synthetase family protein [Acetobacter fabarum]
MSMTEPTQTTIIRATDAALLKQDMGARASVIESTIDALLPPTKGGDARLIDAMRYATLGGGKRLRGYLAVTTASLFGVPESQSARVAASVEMLHAYSLVHDDLPAMDDDDMRRGQPSTHRKFDEATAILAGDALQTRAFEILAAAHTHASADVRIDLIQSFAEASGAAGMVGGQMIDMEGEGRALPLDEVRHLHALKTGCLIRYSAEAGAILGQASADLRKRLRAYGANIGAAFQIADDVLDATATAEELGKTAGKDEASGKSTFVALLGIDGARNEAARVTEAAIAELAPFGAQADRLRDLAYYVIERRN